MKVQEVILFAKASDFTNDDNKQIQTGKIHILGKSVDVTSDYGRKKGVQVAEVKVPLELAQKIIDKVPAVCNIEYTLDVNRDGAYIAVPVDVEFLKEYKI